ncbi:hypothetical protein BDZ89DRAFT_1146042 [Hymenopellis radicata]|nr:hypothetical protein BDZ89DRAFT_1146038 [Hymenopellis radicata]KAF9003500.1 hypothetical protein BDZ89DRAFT_1146042 [Hymenopellis radicata]
MAILDLTLSSFLYPSMCLCVVAAAFINAFPTRLKRDDILDVTSPFPSVFDALACIFRDVDDIAALGLVSSVIVACYYLLDVEQAVGNSF